MKRLFCVLILMIFATRIMGCSSIDSKDSETKILYENTDEGSVGIYSKKYFVTSISEIGVIWDWGNPRLIKFSPVDSGESMVLCYDPNCKHPETSNDNQDPVCMAALYNDHCETAYYNGAVYIFTVTSIGENVLYKMNINGSNREYVATFPFETQLDQDAIFYDNKAYCIASILQTNLEEVEGIKEVEYIDKLVEIDLKKGTYRYVSDEIADYILAVDLKDDNLYVRFADAADGCIYMKKININTAEEVVFISKEEWTAGHRYILVYGEDSYVYWDRNTSEVGIKNLDGTVEKLLLKGPEGESFKACPSCDGMMYRRTMEYEGNAAGYYFMDFDTWEIADITAEVEKYNITYYDGYYDMFVGEITDEYGMIQGWNAWSKAKILGEAME